MCHCCCTSVCFHPTIVKRIMLMMGWWMGGFVKEQNLNFLHGCKYYHFFYMHDHEFFSQCVISHHFKFFKKKVIIIFSFALTTNSQFISSLPTMIFIYVVFPIPFNSHKSHTISFYLLIHILENYCCFVCVGNML